MLQAPPLQAGDLVAIVCPARKSTRHDLSQAIDILESWGLRVRLGQSVGAEDRQFGGEDALRAKDLMVQLADPDVKAVFCARGGYGSARLLPLLDPAVLRGQATWLVGFSDITALHAWVGLQSELVTVHGPMPSTFAGTAPDALDTMRKVLFGLAPVVQSQPHDLNRPGRCSGRLVGGNLSVLYSLRGTPWFPDLDGAILFLEDLDEYRYHVDRMLLNFRLGGLFENLCGLIVGGMTDMRDNAVPFGKDAEAMVAEHAGAKPYPIAMGFPAGHGPDNQPLLLGRSCVLDVNAKGSSLSYPDLPRL